MRHVDRSEIIWEAYPGASNDIKQRINAEGGLVCEQHPWMTFDDCVELHDCAGPGCTKQNAIDSGLLRSDGWPVCPICGEDELYSLAGGSEAERRELDALSAEDHQHHYIETICGCYRCGWRVERYIGSLSGKLHAMLHSGRPVNQLPRDYERRLLGFNGWRG